MTDETIFATALEQPNAAERSAYLDAVCKNDPVQRKRIDGLLAAHAKAVGFLERPAVAAPDPDATTTGAYTARGAAAGDGETRTHGEEHEDDTGDALAFLEPPGRPDSLGRIGHYEVLEVLGRGGFGIVFRAFDEKLQRVVAVKVLSPAMAATSPARKRFLREARSAALIRHEHVVLIHETGEVPLPYLVMEFIPGETLQQRLDRSGPLDVSEVVRVGRQIAEGLAAAHEKGLIHRDIKPSNILIDSGPQQAKITDFGLARAADDASLTRSGTVAGTPMYMAPEQAKGETLDHRADLFSLGSVMYTLLTGHPPFRAETTLAVLKRVAEDTPRPMREVIPETPEWLCRIVEKLHEKNPDDRYQSAKEVADVLADCEKQLQTHSELTNFARIPEAKPSPVQPRSIGRKWKWAIAAGALLFVCVGVLFGRTAVLYATDRGELELLPQEGFQEVIVLQNDEGTLEDKLLPVVTDWLGMTERRLLRLPPGKYQLNAGAKGMITYWEVATSGPLGSRTLRLPGEEHMGWTVIVTVERGKRVSVKPVVRVEPTPTPQPSPQPNDGWVQLFNGKDLTGWKVLPENRAGSWRVENGILVGSGKSSNLFTERGTFGNFRLRMETRIRSGEKGGSVGVATRTPFENFTSIPAAKVYDSNNRPQPQIVWCFDKGARSRGEAVPEDQWFVHHVIVDGRNVTMGTTIDNKTWSASEQLAALNANGHIALHLFDDSSVVEFRKIEIQELPPSTRTPEEQAREEAAMLVGEWVLKSSTVGQQPAPAESIADRKLFILKDGKFMLPITTDEGYAWAVSGIYTIDTQKKQLAFRFGHEPLDAPAVLCTYRVDGDKLVLDFPEPKVGDQESGSTELFAVDTRGTTQRNLKNIGIAMHNSMAKHENLVPPAAIINVKAKDGKPLLSWRVALLPYLEQEALYRQFKLDEPWDSEHNKKLIDKMPKVYEIPGITTKPGHTHYQVFVGPGTAFEPRAAGAKGLSIIDLIDGTSNTFLVVESTDPVIWTRPDDLPYDPKKPLPKLGVYSDGAHVLMGDGSVWRLSPNATEKDIRKAIDRNDGEAMPMELLQPIPWRGPAVKLELQRRAAVSDKERLQGVWVGEAGEARGEPLATDQVRQMRMEFAGGNLRVVHPGKPDQDGTYKLDPAASPKEIDAIRTTDDQVSRGIYKLDGDTLTVCMGDAAPNRPREFRTGADTGPVLLITFRREKATPNQAVVPPLKDAVAARARTLETVKAKYEAGTVSKIELLRAEGELTEAQIKLADAEGNAAAAVARLVDLVKQRQEERDLIKLRVNAGIEPTDVLNTADSRLADAKARLAKAGAPGPEGPPPPPKKP